MYEIKDLFLVLHDIFRPGKIASVPPDYQHVRCPILMEMHWSGTGYSIRYTRLSDI
jgi:hypothetical protein